MLQSLPLAGVLAAAVLMAWPARGDTIDMFTFTESNWSAYTVGAGVQSPVPNALLTGSFTGAVEPGGFIERGDLSAFSAAFTVDGTLVASINQFQLTLFEYDTAGGASSLDFAGIFGAPNNICVGAATALDPNCTVDFTVAYPAGTVGTVELAALPVYVSPDFATITLESSFTPWMPDPAQAPSPGAVPEPSSIFLTGSVLLVVSRLLRRKLTAESLSRA